MSCARSTEHLVSKASQESLQSYSCLFQPAEQNQVPGPLTGGAAGLLWLFVQPLGLLAGEQESCLMRTDKMEATGLLMTGESAPGKGCHPEGRSLV